MTDLEERLGRILKRRLGYNDEEFDSFRKNPRNIELIKKFSELKDLQIILEVVESKGCNSNHKVGDRFYFDFAGNILTDLCPARICGYSLNSAMMMIFAANEMLFAGVDPNEIRFKRASCFDVGIECGGWGRIVLELKIEKK